MGWNTTVVVINDALDQIEKDPEFGRKLSGAIRKRMSWDGMIDVSAGNHCNAASVVETHHADQTAIVTVGGNTGIRQALRFGWDHHTREGQEQLLRHWANELGFRLVRKQTRQGVTR